MSRSSFVLVALLFVIIVTTGCGGAGPLVRPDAEPKTSLSGRIVSAETGDPIAGATVFLAGTTYQDTTGARGAFALEGVPSGSYVVAGNLTGYSPAVKRVTHTAGETGTKRSSAGPAQDKQETVLALSAGGGPTKGKSEASSVSGLDSAVVEALPPATAEAVDAMQRRIDELESRVALLSRQLRQIQEARRGSALLSMKEEDLETFKDYFLGQNREGCRLLNPEALTFQQADEEPYVILKASAEQPLSIVNRQLGYRLQVVLEELRVVSERIGESVSGAFAAGFKPMKPEGEDQTEEWRQERQTAYQGSFLHLMRALAAQRLESEGFVLESKRTVEQTTNAAYEEQIQRSSRWLSVEDASRQVTDGRRSHVKRLQLKGEYRVQNEDDGSDETWRLVVKEAGARFTTFGQPLSAEAIQKRGYQEVRPVCQLLPTDYFPPQ